MLLPSGTARNLRLTLSRVVFPGVRLVLGRDSRRDVWCSCRPQAAFGSPTGQELCEGQLPLSAPVMWGSRGEGESVPMHMWLLPFRTSEKR